MPAVRDPQELGFISAMTDDTFAKYLKWYGLHMGGDYQSPRGLPFRTIAYHEQLEREHPDRAEEDKKMLAEKTKTIRSSRGERVIKGYVGEPINGEDVVATGVKLIYKAIHRKPYPARKKLSLFNCPEHGKDCPENCQYFKKWMWDFNKSKMSFKPLDTTDKMDAIDFEILKTNK
jgi:hypothetical protein